VSFQKGHGSKFSRWPFFSDVSLFEFRPKVLSNQTTRFVVFVSISCYAFGNDDEFERVCGPFRECSNLQSLSLYTKNASQKINWFIDSCQKLSSFKIVDFNRGRIDAFRVENLSTFQKLNACTSFSWQQLVPGIFNRLHTLVWSTGHLDMSFPFEKFPVLEDASFPTIVDQRAFGKLVEMPHLLKLRVTFGRECVRKNHWDPLLVVDCSRLKKISVSVTDSMMQWILDGVVPSLDLKDFTFEFYRPYESEPAKKRHVVDLMCALTRMSVNTTKLKNIDECDDRVKLKHALRRFDVHISWGSADVREFLRIWFPAVQIQPGQLTWEWGDEVF